MYIDVYHAPSSNAYLIDNENMTFYIIISFSKIYKYNIRIYTLILLQNLLPVWQPVKALINIYEKVSRHITQFPAKL